MNAPILAPRGSSPHSSFIPLIATLTFVAGEPSTSSSKERGTVPSLAEDNGCRCTNLAMITPGATVKYSQASMLLCYGAIQFDCAELWLLTVA